MNMSKKPIIRQIPNVITGLNLFSGCLSIVFAFQNKFDVAFYLIILAAVFDFFDGFAARLLNVSSPIGKELDSLADVVSFGVSPSVILFQFFMSLDLNLFELDMHFLPYISFIIPVFSAFRLAKFNLDTRQSVSFLGLPTPANALLICSYVFLPNYLGIIHHPFTLVLMIIVLSLLLVSEIPMFAMKFKTWNFRDNMVKYLFAFSILILFFLVNPLWIGAIAITGYIFVNLLLNLINLKTNIG